MQAGRIWPSAVAVATLGLLLAATAADARGGRSGGRMRGILVRAPSSTSTSSAAIAAPASAPNATSPAAISAPTQAVQPDPPKPTAPTANVNTVGVIAPPPPPAPPTPVPQIAAPKSQVGAIAPLSNTTTTPTAQVTGGSSGVALPETPGGGREGLQACMDFWDSATHMTKAEWKAACQRSTHRLENIAGQKKR
jgi:hypothetical protein